MFRCQGMHAVVHVPDVHISIIIVQDRGGPAVIKHTNKLRSLAGCSTVGAPGAGCHQSAYLHIID